MLNKWVTDEKKEESKRPPIELVNDLSDNDKVNIRVTLKKGSENLLNDDKRVIELFSLENSIKPTNMVIHNEHNHIERFTSASQIIDRFYVIRLNYYN